MYDVGITVGKFIPPHLGHVHLIKEAAKRCKVLYVIIYSNPDPPKFNSEIRANLLDNSILTDNNIYFIFPNHAPKNTSPAPLQHTFVKNILEIYKIEPDVVFSSESYGPSLAKYLNAGHHSVDPERKAYPVSGTEIRNDPYAWLPLLPPPVQRFYQNHYVERVVLMGAESTGKTTTTGMLAKKYNTTWVPEYGAQEFKYKRGKLDKPYDFERIAEKHSLVETQMIGKATSFMFVDTNALITKFYSYYMLGTATDRLLEISNECKNRYHYTFLLNNNIPFDGSNMRGPEENQKMQQGMISMMLQDEGILYVDIKEQNIMDRVEYISEYLDNEKYRRFHKCI